MNEDNTACDLCPAGKISGVASSEVRLHQFPTHFSLPPFTTSYPNPIHRYSQCTVCDTGKFAEKEGSVECQFCNTEEVLKGSITAGEGTTSVSGCICPMGKYLNNETSTCDMVPEGVKKTVEGMNVTTLNLEKGSWRTATDSSEVLMCLAEYHCVGGPDPFQQCKEGHTGPLCAVCEDGYASTGSGLTLKCNICEGGDANQTIAIYLSLLSFIIGLAVTATCCCRRKKSNKDDNIGLIGDDSLATSSRSTRGVSSARAEQSVKKIEGVMGVIADVQPYIKIMFSYFQIVGGMSWGECCVRRCSILLN
jgi:hypothetical protein